METRAAAAEPGAGIETGTTCRPPGKFCLSPGRFCRVRNVMNKN
jgi:hypothetical protein